MAAFVRISQRSGKRSRIPSGQTLLALPEIGQNEQRQDGQQRKLPKAECKWLFLLVKTTEELNLAQEQCQLE
jgi:hypothetical protein